MPSNTEHSAPTALDHDHYLWPEGDDLRAHVAVSHPGINAHNGKMYSDAWHQHRRAHGGCDHRWENVLMGGLGAPIAVTICTICNEEKRDGD